MDAPHHGAVGRDAAAHGGSHAVEHAQKARAGAHDDGHLAAHGAEAVQLHQRDDARHEHGVLQQAHLQVCELTAHEAAGAGDDEQRGEVAHEHGEHVLQAQRDRVAQRHFRLKLVCRIFQFSAFYHIPGSFTSLQVFVTSIENYSRPEPGTVGLFRVFVHIFVISRTSAPPAPAQRAGFLALSVTFGDSSPKGGAFGRPGNFPLDAQGPIWRKRAGLATEGSSFWTSAPCQAVAGLDSGALPFPRHRALLVQTKADRHANGSPFGRAGASAPEREAICPKKLSKFWKINLKSFSHKAGKLCYNHSYG